MNSSEVLFTSETQVETTQLSLLQAGMADADWLEAPARISVLLIAQ